MNGTTWWICRKKSSTKKAYNWLITGTLWEIGNAHVMANDTMRRLWVKVPTFNWECKKMLRARKGSRVDWAKGRSNIRADIRAVGVKLLISFWDFEAFTVFTHNELRVELLRLCSFHAFCSLMNCCSSIKRYDSHESAKSPGYATNEELYNFNINFFGSRNFTIIYKTDNIQRIPSKKTFADFSEVTTNVFNAKSNGYLRVEF